MRRRPGDQRDTGESPTRRTAEKERLPPRRDRGGRRPGRRRWRGRALTTRHTCELDTTGRARGVVRGCSWAPRTTQARPQSWLVGPFHRGRPTPPAWPVSIVRHYGPTATPSPPRDDQWPSTRGSCGVKDAKADRARGWVRVMMDHRTWSLCGDRHADRPGSVGAAGSSGGGTWRATGCSLTSDEATRRGGREARQIQTTCCRCTPAFMTRPRADRDAILATPRQRSALMGCPRRAAVGD